MPLYRVRVIAFAETTVVIMANNRGEAQDWAHKEAAGRPPSRWIVHGGLRDLVSTDSDVEEIACDNQPSPSNGSSSR